LKINNLGKKLFCFNFIFFFEKVILLQLKIKVF